MGYFRDDQPLYELILDDKQQTELDEMWQEMDFVASATIRMYTQFCATASRQGGGAGRRRDEPAASAPMDEEVTSEAKIKQLEARYLAWRSGGDAVASRPSRTISIGSTTASAGWRKPGWTPSRAIWRRCWISPPARIGGR